jgi:hypothetical protein
MNLLDRSAPFLPLCLSGLSLRGESNPMFECCLLGFRNNRLFGASVASPMLLHTRLGERVIHLFDTTRDARATGERDVAADAADFQTFKMLAEETRASYEVFYYPDLCDGKFHDLRLKTSHPGVQLRVNHNGYVAAAK